MIIIARTGSVAAHGPVRLISLCVQSETLPANLFQAKCSSTKEAGDHKIEPRDLCVFYDLFVVLLSLVEFSVFQAWKSTMLGYNDRAESGDRSRRSEDLLRTF